MSPRRDNAPPADPAPAPPSARPAPAPATWAGVVGEHLDRIPGLIGQGLQIGGTAIAVATPEGRAAVGAGLNVISEYFQLWIAEITDFNSAMGGRMRNRLLWLFGMLVLGMLTTWLSHDLSVRFQIEALLGMITAVMAISFSIHESRWFVTVGAAKHGFSAIKQEHIASLFRFNPFDLVFAAVPPAISGAIGMFWIYTQIMMKIGFYGMLVFAYYMFSFWHVPWLILSGPFLLFSFVILVVAYTEVSKGQLWFFWIFMNVVALCACLLLTIFPGFTGWVQTAGSIVAGVLCLVVAGLARYGVIWSSGQAANHDAKMGKVVAGAAAPSRRAYDSDAGRMLALPIIAICATVVLVVWMFLGMYNATDHLHKTTGVLQEWLAEHNLDLTHGGMRGINAVPEATAATAYASNIRSEGTDEIGSHTVSLPVRIGPMSTPVEVQAGDVVTVTAMPSTYGVYDSAGDIVRLNLSGFFLNGSIATPEDDKAKMDKWKNDFPSVRLPDGGLLARIGEHGEFLFVGTDGQFVVTGSGRHQLWFYLNLPQRREFNGAIVPNQTITVTITVKRPRRG